jgi:hypothetical protein
MKYGLNLITKDIFAAMLSLVLIALVFVFIGASFKAHTSPPEDDHSVATTVNRNVGNNSEKSSADMIEAIRSREIELPF